MQVVFISGMQRSGTTMLEQTLNSNPHIFITHELNWIHMLRSINGALFHPRYTSRKVLPFQGNYNPIFELLYQGSSPKTLTTIGDKLPDYVLHFETLHKFFSDAKHLYCLRDPIDVINSMIGRAHDTRIGLDRGWEGGLDIEAMCLKYTSRYNSYLGFKSRNLKNIQLIRYEEITTDPKPILHKISEFIGCNDEFDLDLIKPTRKSREYLSRENISLIEKRVGGLLSQHE